MVLQNEKLGCVISQCKLLVKQCCASLSITIYSLSPQMDSGIAIEVLGILDKPAFENQASNVGD